MRGVCITGAGGFIGQALMRSCPENIQIAALSGPDDKELQCPGAVAMQRVGDIVDQELLEELCTGCDTVVHLAGPASVAQSFLNPAETLRSHVLGAGALTAAMQRTNVRRLVFVSSAEVYGRTQLKFATEDSKKAPRSPYAAAKLSAEAVFTAAARASQLEVLLVRPFSVYGPGQRSNGLLDSLMTQVLGEAPVKLFDLSPCRDYVHVDDVCRALWLAVTIERLHCQIEVVNLASGRGITVGELADCVLQLAGRAGESVVESGNDRARSSDIHSLIGCTQRAEHVLGWHAEIDLHTGLKNTLGFYLPKEN